MTDEASTGGTNPRSERAASSGVHLTRIYTRTGDDGTTGLSDFSRVPKNDPRLIAYADCDEANAAIGVAVVLGNPVGKSVPYCCRSKTICSTPVPTCPPPS